MSRIKTEQKQRASRLFEVAGAMDCRSWNMQPYQMHTLCCCFCFPGTSATPPPHKRGRGGGIGVLCRMKSWEDGGAWLTALSPVVATLWTHVLQSWRSHRKTQTVCYNTVRRLQCAHYKRSCPDRPFALFCVRSPTVLPSKTALQEVMCGPPISFLPCKRSLIVLTSKTDLLAQRVMTNWVPITPC